jgi:hypothetical protein
LISLEGRKRVIFRLESAWIGRENDCRDLECVCRDCKTDFIGHDNDCRGHESAFRGHDIFFIEAVSVILEAV